MQRLINQQNGSALLTSLLVMVLAVIVGTYIAMTLASGVRSTNGLLDASTAEQVLQGVQVWANAEIIQATEAQLENHNAILQLPKQFEALAVAGGQVTGVLRDAQAYFNLNQLVNPLGQFQFAHLLSVVEPGSNANDALKLARSIQHWVMPSNDDDIYTRLAVPYKAPHRPMVDGSELRLVRGISATDYQQLAPYVIALPGADIPINVNTAPAAVIASLSPSMDLAQAEAIVACREQQGGFTDLSQFAACTSAQGIATIDEDKITLTSRYYLVQGYYQKDQQYYQLTSLLRQSEDDQGKLTVEQLWQHH